MRPRFKVSLSAVTSECGETRRLVESDFRSRGLEVKFQEDFRQEPTTLKKLHGRQRGSSEAQLTGASRRQSSDAPGWLRR
jgi:hypothetical protein